MFRKGRPAFADENMLQVYELARILIDQVTPPDRNACYASIPTGSPHPTRCHRIQLAFIENLRGMRKAGTGLRAVCPLHGVTCAARQMGRRARRLTPFSLYARDVPPAGRRRRAFSREVDLASREENALEQKVYAPVMGG
jgi:hypothetical protein